MKAMLLTSLLKIRYSLESQNLNKKKKYKTCLGLELRTTTNNLISLGKVNPFNHNLNKSRTNQSSFPTWVLFTKTLTKHNKLKWCSSNSNNRCYTSSRCIKWVSSTLRVTTLWWTTCTQECKTTCSKTMACNSNNLNTSNNSSNHSQFHSSSSNRTLEECKAM
jgi:hypothetical protein